MLRLQRMQLRSLSLPHSSSNHRRVQLLQQLSLTTPLSSPCNTRQIHMLALSNRQSVVKGNSQRYPCINFLLHRPNSTRPIHTQTIPKPSSTVAPVSFHTLTTPTRSSSRSLLSTLALIGGSMLSMLILSRDELYAASSSSSDSSTTPRPRRPSQYLPPGDTISDIERTSVQQLRTLLLDHIDSPSCSWNDAMKRYVIVWATEDDWVLLRYLRAHKLRLQDAAAGIESTAWWRLSNDVDSLTAEDLIDLLRHGHMSVLPVTTSQGRSIMWYAKSTKPAESNDWNEETERRNQACLIYTQERAMRVMEDAVDNGEIDPSTHEQLDFKSVWVVDLRGYTKSSATPWHVTRALIDTMRFHYPERLHCAIIIDAPWILRSLCNLLKPFIDKVTRDKIHFVHNRSSPQTYSLMLSVLGPDGVAALPASSDVQGARGTFDLDEYVRTDPLAKGRTMTSGAGVGPTVGQVANSPIDSNHAVATSSTSTPVQQASSSWWRPWSS